MSRTETLTLPVDGMTCASCAGRVERAAAAVPGVRAARVNLAAETVTIEGEAAPAAIAEALASAGYPARTQVLAFDVEGMSCASCTGRVERALRAVPGVTEARVNLATGRASVTAIEGTDPASVAAAAAAAGYPARLHGAEAPRPDRKAEEAAGHKRRTIVAAVLTLPLFVVEMGGHVVPGLRQAVEGAIGLQALWVVQFVLATIVLAGPGAVFFRRGVPALLKGAPDMNALVALGTGAAWTFSTVATFAPGLLPAGTANVYFEAAAVIVTLILLGRWLEARARGRTGAAIAGLLKLRPDTARVERDGEVVEVAIDALGVGDVVQLRPGERVAADGTVLRGASFVDESMITGEPMPVGKAAGDPVTGGTLNGTGALSFAVARVGADSVLSRIVAMVEEAQGARLPIQALVDRVTARFVPAVLALAALTVGLWLVLGPDPALGLALVAGVSVLIIACPCAMGLATPTSIMVGTGRAAEMGVLFRRGDALQSLQGVRVVAFDKTGTLTEGRPALTDIAARGGFAEEEVLRLAAAAEAASEHPIGAAVVQGARARGLAEARAEAFESLTGLGLRASVEGRAVLIGSERLMTREGVALGDAAEGARALARRGRTPLFVAIDGALAAMLGVADPVRPEARAAIAALHAQGVRTAMISGDAAGTANAVAAELGIDDVVAEVMPDGKVAALEALRAAHGAVAFVGDGINDAPALATADVGIAIGTGTDIAIEAADVVLMAGDPGGVARAFEVSRATMRNVRQNLVWAFGYNVLLIPVAMGVLWPAFGVLLSPALAAAAMALSSIFVLSNALRLRRIGRGRGTTPRPPASGAAPAPVPAE